MTTSSKQGGARPADFNVLTGLAQIRALAQKDRLRILGQLSNETLSSSAVARSLDLPANRVHYHIQQLCEAGLAREVETRRKGQTSERFYRATARHFLVDPHLGCQHEETSATVLRSMESAFLDWRRDEVLDVDLARIARRVVHDSLRVGRNETVLVMFGPQAIELAESILIEIQAAGARSICKLWSRHTVLSTLDRYAGPELDALPFLHPEVDESIDAVAHVSTTIPQGAPPSPAQQNKLPHLLKTVASWQRSVQERGTRYVEITVPHRGEFLVDPEAAINSYWSCFEADLDEISRRGGSLVEIMGADTDFEITCGLGGHAVGMIDPALTRIQDGAVSEIDISRGHSVESLPAGTCTMIPVAGTVSGRVCTDYVSLAGRHFENVQLTLHEGVITGIEADDDGFIRTALDSAAGEPATLSSIEIGLNPHNSKLTGKPALDSCLAGVVTLTFGNNELLGGKVASTISFSPPSRKWSLRVGGRDVVLGGRLA